MSGDDWASSILRDAELYLTEKGPRVDRLGAASIDSRRTGGGDTFFALPGERTDGHRFAAEALERGAALALLSDEEVFADLSRRYPRKKLILVSDVLDSLQILAAARVGEAAPWTLGITGSNGKTGTKNYCAAALSVVGKTVASRGNLNNLIGLPLCLFDLSLDTQFLVNEMGCSGFGEIARLAELFEPAGGVITNVGEAHLEQLRDRAGVARAKRELAEALPPEGLLLVCGDDRYAAAMPAVSPARAVRAFGFGERNDLRLEDLGPEGGGRLMRLDGRKLRLRSPMRHSILQAGAAWLAGRFHGADPEALAASLEAVEPEGNRSALYRLGEWTVMDDSYNANPDSLRAALDWLADYPAAGRRWALLGDMLEMGESGPMAHAEFGKKLAEAGTISLMSYGTLSAEMTKAAREKGLASAEHFEEHEALASALIERLRPGDVILVKGSRGLEMERVIGALERLSGQIREAVR